MCKVLTASDIPTGGKNDITGAEFFKFGSTEVEEVRKVLAPFIDSIVNPCIRKHANVNHLN